MSVTTVGVGPAAANHVTGRYYSGHDEAFMRYDGAPGPRSTFVVDPGVGNLLSRQQLMANEAFYNHFGFSDNFLWFAPAQVVRLGPQTWSRCEGAPYHPMGVCPIANVRSAASYTVASTFGGEVDLHVFEYRGAFIAQVCGNFSDAPPSGPTPKIRGTKFHDLDRDGVHDDGEGKLAGWTFRLVRESSMLPVPQPAGLVATATSGPDGSFEFVLTDADGIGPGVYFIEEVAQEGWTRTTPDRRYVTVDFGIGDAVLPVEPFGNVENRTDVVKADMEVLGMPEELTVGVATDVVMRSVIRNDGPAGPIEVLEELAITVPADCAATPSRREDRLVLGRGETRAVDVTVRLLCDLPSFHDFQFANRLSVLTPGVTDTAPTNNERFVSITRPVIAYADLSIDSLELDCPDRADRGETLTCVVTAELTNNGPYGPVEAATTLELIAPDDCTLSPVGAQTHMSGLGVGTRTVVASRWETSCDRRSYHRVEAAARIAPADQHVRDLSVGNDGHEDDDVVQIFEPTDLALSSPQLLCDESWTPDPFNCTFRFRATNLGPATAVYAAADVSLEAAPTCVTTPPRNQNLGGLVLDPGESIELFQPWQVSCSDADRLHSFLAVARIHAAEPHAEDRNPINDAVQVRTGPLDIKPHSDPNSLNMRSQGVTAAALLSTAEFDAVVSVDPTSVRFGGTGTEAPALRCSAEDANGDALADLVCHFLVSSTGFRVDDTRGLVTASLTDGTPYTAWDKVRILHA